MLTEDPQLLACRGLTVDTAIAALARVTSLLAVVRKATVVSAPPRPLAP